LSPNRHGLGELPDQMLLGSVILSPSKHEFSELLDQMSLGLTTC